MTQAEREQALAELQIKLEGMTLEQLRAFEAALDLLLGPLTNKERKAPDGPLGFVPGGCKGRRRPL